MSDAPISRPYRSSLREEQAAQTRQRILASAGECFARRGYAGTSLADIAAGAGVSVESVKLSGPKRDLLLAAFELAFAGSEGPRSVGDSDAVRAITDIPDNDAFLAALVGFVADANERTSGLWAGFLSAATSEPVVAESLAGLLERRRADYRDAVAELDRRGMVGSADDRDEIAAALSFLLSPESYDQLVVQSGWPKHRYVAWLVEATRRIVLAE
ncbi:AcrR family transcriptional regulator [Conyzicola lurida]|uniref:AcrR family transcriptional regulator n=1 Tax=Conyzicola lurida TaxID=1172621 RepID=A0A841AJI1_9MICO|nr:TetR/AcrR family transcriptional regulator [Conyzicola lurida]MBB5841861.1 AcrR family transcriptional regulator [Conyzicola lurida]